MNSPVMRVMAISKVSGGIINQKATKMREKQFKKLEFSDVATLGHHHFSTEKHIPFVCAHEIAQIAARLAEDAIDRRNDNLEEELTQRRANSKSKPNWLRRLLMENIAKKAIKPYLVEINHLPFYHSG